LSDLGISFASFVLTLARCWLITLSKRS